MVGAPGSGKSTATHRIATNKIIVSRDGIRFSLVKEDEPYFLREKEVFKEYCDRINNSLSLDGKNVIADATHLNASSRNKLLRKINTKPDKIIAVYMKTPLKECIKRNEQRAGTRAYVPPEQIEKMFKSIEAPAIEEGFDEIWIYENEKLIIEEKEK